MDGAHDERRPIFTNADETRLRMMVRAWRNQATMGCIIITTKAAALGWT